jgi:UDP-N-acetylglucosamine 1-carboxyvinyltransferase
MAATLLVPEPCLLHGVPYELEDVRLMMRILESLGVKLYLHGDDLTIDASHIDNIEAPYELVSGMRASFVILGPLLARMREAKVAMPGGCAIGTRPIDLHLKGLEALGAELNLEYGYVNANVVQLHGKRIYLDFPSVGATQNIMMAATLADGTTIIENAAAEPEISDLATFLNSCGAKIHGAGTNLIRIEGVTTLTGCQHEIIPDRIEAGTFLVAAALTRGDVLVENAVSNHLKPVIAKLRESGHKVMEYAEGIHVVGGKSILPTHITTLPHPGFPTDMQAQFMAMLTLSLGNSTITETVFENRFMHVNEFIRMGANIRIDGRIAYIQGVKRLTGAPVRATDLRAGSALLLAGMAAEGETIVHDVFHIDRGYMQLEKKLKGIGIQITRNDS